MDARFVAFGGGVGRDQLTWLSGQLADATSAAQRVVCFSHQPLHPGTVPGGLKSLCWNYDEVHSRVGDRLAFGQLVGATLACSMFYSSATVPGPIEIAMRCTPEKEPASAV